MTATADSSPIAAPRHRSHPRGVSLICPNFPLDTSHRVIITAAADSSSITAPRHCSHITGGAFQCPNAFATRHFPHSYRVVITATADSGSIIILRHRSHTRGAFKCSNATLPTLSPCYHHCYCRFECHHCSTTHHPPKRSASKQNKNRTELNIQTQKVYLF